MRLAAEHAPLNRTSVEEILVEEVSSRLLRGPESEASISPATPLGRDTNLPGWRSWTSAPGQPGWSLSGPGCCKGSIPAATRMPWLGGRMLRFGYA